MVKEIESTVYVTSNGEKFVDKEKADAREILVEAHRKLSEYRIKDIIHLYNVFISENNYREIYKIESKKEFNEFIESLHTFYNKDLIPEDDIYTKIIHNDYDTSCIFYTYLFMKNYDFDGYNYRDAIIVYSLNELKEKFMQNVNNIDKLQSKLNKEGDKKK